MSGEKWSEEEQKAYEKEVMAEVMAEVRRYDRLKDVSYRCFVSTSNGKDRPKRRPRVVELVKISETVYTVGEDQIKSRKDRRGLAEDRLAQEHGFERSDEFLDEIRRRSR